MIDWKRYIETPIKLYGKPIKLRKRKKKVIHIPVKRLGLSTGIVVIVRVIK